MEPVLTHYQVDGAPGAPWVTFITGIANDLSMWDGQVPALARDFRVLRYDLRGQGRTPATDPPYTIALLVDDLVAARERLPILPDVPTMAEAGFPGVEASGWNGIFVPAGTPAAIVSRLHDEIAKWGKVAKDAHIKAE